jgi:thiol:disulfide interchange protein DsbD
MTPIETVQSFSDLGWAYLAGLATVLTPCIYPLIPVTVNLLGVAAHLPRWKAFLLASSYVGGICLTYTVLGLIAGKTGGLFGAFLGHPVVVAILCAFLVLLALFSLDVVPLNFIGRI